MPDAHINRKVFVKQHKLRFEAWLTARGAEVLAPTNEWEMCRFRTDAGTSVVYARKQGTLTWVGEAGIAFEAYLRNNRWRATPVTPRNKRSSPTCRTLRQRDGDTCFFCHLPVEVEDESVEHLVAVTHGGPDHIANMALSCKPCNLRAGHLSLMEKIRLREQGMIRGFVLESQPYQRAIIEALSEPTPPILAAIKTSPPWET